MTHKLIQSALQKLSNTHVELDSVTELEEGPQGFSGAELRYFDVIYSVKGLQSQRTLVVKDAQLNERKTYARLNSQALSVPLGYTTDLSSDEPKPLCLQHVGNKLQKDERLQESAQALAQLHFANLGCAGALSWLPQLDTQYVKAFLVDACWRRAWNSLSNGGEFIDGYGNHHGQPKPGGDFVGAFGDYTDAIEEKAEQLVETVANLWTDAGSLTLIHGDLHNDHFCFDGQAVYIIDWGSAHYGPLYFDLPNFFTRDEVQTYRDSLEALGYDVSATHFLANYDAVKSFVGFKYFGIGLWNWCYGDTPHQPESVMYFINTIIK